MKAPDKIYIQPSTIDVLPRQNIIYTKRLSDTSIEYLRKDALLEWAKDMKAETEGVIKQHPEDESLWAEMHWWEVVMEKINAM